MKSRTWAAALAAVCLAALLGPTPAQARPEEPRVGAAFAVPFDHTGARLGATVTLDDWNGREELTAIRNFETKWQNRADYLRVFVKWSTPQIVTPAQQTLAEEGRTLIISWNSYGQGTGIRWSQVASGAYDADIDRRAQQVKAIGQRVLFTFQHEPDNQTDQPSRPRAGTPADFCNAYRHVVDRFRLAGVSNASYGVIMMAISGKNGTAERYYCGPDHLDWLGVDGYNWYGCVSPSGPWALPADIFSKWYAWAAPKGLPLIIAEWGTGEDPALPGRKAAWIDSLSNQLKAWPSIKGALIFNAGVNKHCPRYSDTSPTSQAAFVAMGADPYYNP